jgi:hypothetical protein
MQRRREVKVFFEKWREWVFHGDAVRHGAG